LVVVRQSILRLVQQGRAAVRTSSLTGRVGPEGEELGVILHVREGEISELEIYSPTGEANGLTLPLLESIARWPD
jgi:hypothetical protein